jgi:hypothetical protein
MRYFLTTTARRPVVAAGKSFTFEPVGQWGGSWLGVFACADEADANILAEACSNTLEEITFEQYDAKKKALSLTGNDSHALRKPPSENPLNHVVAEVAGSLSPAFKPNGGPNSTEGITRVSIFNTERTPPQEAILDSGGPRKRW